MKPPRTFSEFEELESCPVCGSQNHSNVFGASVRGCSDCGLIFRSPRPTQNQIKLSYDEGSQYSEWAVHAKQIAVLWLKRIALVRKYLKSGFLLDVGVGDGRFLSLAKQAGFEVEGTEISDTGGSMAQSLGFTIHFGQLTEIDFKGRQYSAITIWHVLEHVPNPGEVLSKLWSLLEPGGLLFVAVPNEENALFRYRVKKKPSNPLGELGWGTEIHLTHFQPWTLKNALKSRGFGILEFGVDDVYHSRSLRNRTVLQLQKGINRIFRWHFSMAMYAVCQKQMDSQANGPRRSG